MNKKWIPVVVAIIGIIPIAGGGAATNWTFQIGDNTNIDSHDVTTGDTIFGDIGSDIALDIWCLQDPIPDQYIKACKER